MSISDRIHNTIEDWQAEWKDRLRGWALRTLSEGAKKFLEDDELEAIDNVRDMIAKLRASPDIPPEIKAQLDRLEEGGSWWQLVMAIAMGVQALMGLVTTLWQPGLKQMSYPEERIAQTYRLDPMAVITAWRRAPEVYEKLFEDLRDQGWSEVRIQALKFATLFMPSAGDIVSWYAKEVYEPDMITKYGLDSELPNYEETDFPKIGVDSEQARNYWRAHWEHASWMQVVEMLHRGLLSEEDVWDWFRLVEIPPFWRQHLIDTAYTWPTRVDVRRWWDMRTIDEARLRELYQGMGYRGENLEDYIRWTKVYTDFSMMMSRWSKGWITLEDVRVWLRGLGIPEERVEHFIQEKVKPDGADRVTSERDLTKTDIYKGVKQGQITRDQAIDLLMDLGFDEDEADYLLAINIPRDEEDVIVEARKISKADILKGLKAEVITRDEAKSMLMELRYSVSNAELLLRIYDALVEVPVEPKLREASKADIIKGVKKGLITHEEAYLMLLDIGFTSEASMFILDVHVEESPFSPISYAEFKELTEKYKRAAGRLEVAMPEELKKAADKVVQLTIDLESLRRAIEDEKRGLIDVEEIPEAASARLKKLQVKANRAESALALAKSEYDKQVAEWRHTPV